MKRWLARAFLLVVGVLLVRLSQEVDWAEAWQALQSLSGRTLWAAGGLCVLSHALYSSYDLIGRHQTRHGLAAWRSASVGFMSYAFNLNLGALVGGVAFRYRLYSSLGLDAPTITRVLLLSMLTNWLGYFALAGGVLLLAPPELPAHWGLAHSAMPLAGVALLLVALGYVAACFAAGGRTWRLRGHAFTLPSGCIALLQLLLAAASWALIASIVWALLQQRVPYPLVLGALLAYRALYYLLPLVLAAAFFVAFNAAMKKGGRGRPSDG